jgi:beta-1,4-mannosyl-glycoprotein beta-1,4-N-acetylglucosaminyltransferase
VIVDCFTFSNELDVLEWRLSILDAVVDRFVLCEGTQTFRGVPKPLVFDANRERFARWAHKLEHLVYDVPPDPNPWTNEGGQRAYLTRALAGAAPDDVVMMGDVDEIPDPANVVRRPAPGRIVAHRQRLSLCYVNAVRDEPWIGTKAIAVGDLAGRTLDDLRQAPLEQCDLVDGGWHFTSLGGPHVLASKYHVYSHREIELPYYADVAAIAAQFATEGALRWQPVASLPPILHDERWAAYRWERPPTDPEAARLGHAHGCYASLPDGAAPVAVAATQDAVAWERAGRERFAARFAGVRATIAAAAALVPRDGWTVVDGLEAFDPDDLRGAAERGVCVVAYARNARSVATIAPVLHGAPFPPGPLYGEPELRALVEAAGYEVVHVDPLRRARFNGLLLERPEPIRVDIGPFGFEAATRARLADFDSDAYVFTLRPRATG